MNITWDEIDEIEPEGSITAVVDMGTPATNPDAPATCLFLTIEWDIDEDKFYESEGFPEDAFIWRFGISEEEAGFGEAEHDRGSADNLEQAMKDCADSVEQNLLSDGFTPEEIAAGGN